MKNVIGPSRIFLAHPKTRDILPPQIPNQARTPTIPPEQATPETPLDRDLTELLEEWPFQPGQINVRLIQGNDSEPRIQVRLDLGILQMFVDGRPDGQRPHGFDSLLEYHESRLDELHGSKAMEAALSEDEDEDEETEATEEELRILTPEDCRLLREEAVQYYHRYIALLVLEDYEGVARDTSRNLRVLDLIYEHAESEEDRRSMEQNRPYIMMMRARALASLAIKDDEPKAAVHAIEQGIDALRQYFADRGVAEAFDASGEVAMLREMRDALVPKLPLSQRAELRQRLEAAIAAENYELAAILRDELRMLGDGTS